MKKKYTIDDIGLAVMFTSVFTALGIILLVDKSLDNTIDFSIHHQWRCLEEKDDICTLKGLRCTEYSADDIIYDNWAYLKRSRTIGDKTYICADFEGVEIRCRI